MTDECYWGTQITQMTRIHTDNKFVILLLINGVKICENLCHPCYLRAKKKSAFSSSREDTPKIFAIRKASIGTCSTLSSNKL